MMQSTQSLAELLYRALGEFPVLFAFMAWAYYRDKRIDLVAEKLAALATVVARAEALDDARRTRRAATGGGG